MAMSQKPLFYSLSLLVCFTFQNCASKMMYMTPVSIVKPDSVLQITDEQIREAFKTQPQLTKPLIVALYNASFDDYPLLDSLEKLNSVSNAFTISPWLIEGDEYKTRSENPWYYHYREPSPTPIKAVRLQAAKGKADLLIYCGITHSYKENQNWLAWSYIGLITMGFVPGQKCRLTTSVDMFFIDVRNGFSYGTYHDEITEKKDFVRMSYSGSMKFEDKKRKQVMKLLPGMLKASRRILDNKAFYLEPASQKKTDSVMEKASVDSTKTEKK